MAKLKLVKGLSYSYGDLKATKDNPYIDVKDKAAADHLVETGYFETVVPVLGHKETPKSAEQASVSMPAPEPTITQPSVLEGMNTDELRAYAQKQGISLRGVKTRKAIIKAIEDAEKRATEALKALRES
jgi:hypothetical protein